MNLEKRIGELEIRIETIQTTAQLKSIRIIKRDQRKLAQAAGAAEYTDCISAEGLDSPNECPRYDTKRSNEGASVMLELWGMQSTLSLPLLRGPP